MRFLDCTEPLLARNVLRSPCCCLGTAKQFVVQDYSTRLSTSEKKLRNSMARMVEVLLGKASAEADAPMLAFEKSTLALESGKVRALVPCRSVQLTEALASQLHPVIFHNPLAWKAEEIVSFFVDTLDVAVLGKDGKAVPCQVRCVVVPRAAVH